MAVYSPNRKQILRWGEFGNDRNSVRAFNAEKGTWSADYEPDKAQFGGNFYGGMASAGWMADSNRPGPFFLFRQGCWDSKRSRMVIVALNLTAAYDPIEKKWTDLKGAFDDGHARKEGCAPKSYEGPWFAPVPGQWGSCAYDPLNDQIILFPLWVCRFSGISQQSLKKVQFGPDLLEDAGVAAGHYGTFVFDCESNTWRLPELGDRRMLAERKRWSELINAQRDSARRGWTALIAFRQENISETLRLMREVAATQKKVTDDLVAEKAVLSKLATEFTGYEQEEIASAIRDLDLSLSRASKASAGLAEGKPDTLPVLCTQQQALYRELRVILDQDLYVQPISRCSTSVVYDSKNQYIVMAGGTHLDHTLNDTWIYDCKTKKWQRRASVPEGMEWPGMCFDSKRGLTIYTAINATYAYDAAKDKWTRVGAGIPKYGAQGFYCNMEYEPGKDVYILNTGTYGQPENCYAMRPADLDLPVNVPPAARESIDDTPFPPPAEQAVLDRLTNLPENTWVAAKPNFEPTHRSWSRMDWDPTLRCVIYQGGGHAGTMDNTISAYFPEANKWVNAFPTQHTPSIFGNWCCASHMLAFERGMGLAAHARAYRSLDGKIVAGQAAGFEWSTRDVSHASDAPERLFSNQGALVDISRRRLISFLKGHYYDTLTNHLQLTSLDTGKVETVKMSGDCPAGGWMCVVPSRNLLFSHAYDDKSKSMNSWILDLAKLDGWKKIELTSNTSPMQSEGSATVLDIPGTDYLVLASKDSKDLWVYSFELKTWKMLPTADGDKGAVPFGLYPQIVWDTHHKIFACVINRGGGYVSQTLLLRPNFDKVPR